MINFNLKYSVQCNLPVLMQFAGMQALTCNFCIVTISLVRIAVDLLLIIAKCTVTV